MEYNLEANPYRIVGIIIIACLFIWYFPITHNFLFPVPKTIETTKLVYINNTEYITLIPTPDGKTYWANEYDSGLRKINNPFSYIDYNTSDGISKNNPFKFSVNVYDYRVFDYLHWFNSADYKYYAFTPKDGYKFLFIFVDSSIDDVISDNIRIWLPSSDKFVIQYNYETYSEVMDIETKQLRFRELENIPNINNDGYIQYYAQKRMYADIDAYRDSAGEYSEQQYYLYEGYSNRMNGYILYEIPDYINIKDIYVISNFGGFGYSSWKLKGF